MFNRQTASKMLIFCSVTVLVSTTLAVVSNQYDNFQDGTTQNWGSGNPNPNPPTNISTGGPSGLNDNYLLATSTGSPGAGGKLVLINSTQWTGDYVTAGVQFVSMYIKNFGVTTLSMRIALQGPGGNFWSVNPIIVDPTTEWQPISFSVQPASLTGGANVNSTLSGVTSFRILHSVAGGFTGDNIAAQIGVDNITAASQPVPVELVNFSVSVLGKSAMLEWTTATETNNYGFEIERTSFSNIPNKVWVKIGFTPGAGNSSSPKMYTFVDSENRLSGKYLFRLKQIDMDGSYEYSNEIEAEIQPGEYTLEQNYPNPFNPSTKIKFNIPMSEKVKIEVFNAVGNKVTTLLNGLKEAGSHEVQFEAENLASGVYFYKISVGNFIQIKKMVLIR